MPWLTGDSADLCQATINIPQDEYFYAALIGAVSRLAIAENWQEYGAITPDQAANLFASVLSSFNYCGGGIVATGLRYEHSSNQNISHNTVTDVDFDTEIYSAGDISITDGTITIADTGYYLINAGIRWNLAGSTGIRELRILAPGTEIPGIQGATYGEASQNCSVIKYLETDDTIKIQVLQTTGSTGVVNASKSTYISAFRLA